jgi:hypothetical protein
LISAIIASLGVEVEAAHLVLVDSVELVGGRADCAVGHPGGAHLDHVRDDLDADVRQQCLGDGARCDARCGLASARAFEHVACVGEPVLLHPGEVGVAGAHLGERCLGGAGSGAHLLVPLVAAEPLAVLDLDRDRRAERSPVAYPTDQRELVGLESLPWPAAVAETPTTHLVLDLLDGDREPGRQSFHHDDQRLPVGFARREIPQHRVEVTG